ncbi:uncharacterized protein LOC143558915 [Bidens hawaiensis]|uniref:uncharacterized protein LOC143558915 n=1 Tax=Bidens hawaiensis TaxID=980011 RepID=UPI00404A557A
MNNQGNYQQYRGLVPPRPQYVTPVPAPVPSGGTLTSGQTYMSWGQSQRMPPPALVPPHGQHQIPRIPPPGQQFYRVQPPPRLPPLSSAYFTPAPPPGSFVLPPQSSAPPPGPPPLPPPIDGNSHVIGSDVPPPPPRDEKIAKQIEVLCQYIAKNGEKFEEITRQKEAGNPDFEFLFGGAPGSEAAISHEYFKWMKRKCMFEKGHNRDLSLKPSAVATLQEDTSHSPGGSDMDMEDDITHPEEPATGNTFGNVKHEAAFISNGVDIKAENESTRAIEQSTNNNTIGPNLTLNDTHIEKSKLMVGAVVSESLLDCKTEDNINLYQETNQSEQSPFRLIQGYASDDNSENDNDPHFENVSPVAVSPQDKEHSTLPVHVVEGSLNIISKVSEPSLEKKLENRTDDGASIKQNNRSEGDGTSGPKNSGGQKEDNNAKLKTDEFGRVLKRGGSDSDSDDYSARRRVKRGRSRSRSRSPYERRRSRSPYGRWRRSPRRRDKRSPSRSWSPRKRDRSRSPYSRRNTNQSQEICHDFRRGRCFRGATCRYSHELEKSEESRRHKNKQYHHEVPDRIKSIDKLAPEKDEVDYHVSRSIEPPGHSAEVASGHETEHPATETAPPPTTLWNSLPSALPHPQVGGPMSQYQLNPPPYQTNYPFQPFVTPYGPPINYPILQQPVGPMTSLPNLVSSNSRILSHYNPYSSTFDLPLSTKFSSGVFNQDYGSSANQNHTPDEGQTRNFTPNPLASGGDQYDPLFDSIDPSSNSVKKTDAIAAASEEKEEFGETADAEVGAVENDSPSPSSPTDLPDMATGEVEIDQVKNKKSKDSRSMKHFKIAIAEFVKEVLKPSWRQGNMSKEAFKTIVKKTVDKVSGAIKKHHIPKSQTKINHYIDSSQRKLTKLVMGYVDKYVKV